MKYWDYRVVKNVCTEPSGTEEETLEIKEIYYDENDEPILVSDAAIMCESLEELKAILKDLSSALNKPILNYSDIVKKHYPKLFDDNANK